jgi:hypothetical protein
MVTKKMDNKKIIQNKVTNLYINVSNPKTLDFIKKIYPKAIIHNLPDEKKKVE